MNFPKNLLLFNSVIDELRSENYLFETSQQTTKKKLKNPHHWLMQNLVQIKAFQQTLTVLDTVTMPQIKLYSFRFIFQLIRITLDESRFKNFSNHFTEQAFFPFLIKTENLHPENLNLF